MKIVAPAGNKDRFYVAIKAGAEEIYMGLKGFGARRAAENFTMEEFIAALDYAHLRGCRIFLTLNTVMTKEEIDFLYPNLKKLYEHGLDAIIIQDLGLAYFCKKNFPNLELHGSTQLSVANHIEINFLETLGFQRIVLPRELSFEEIKSIREHTNIELEIFVSGALCICYSGNCYLSSFLGGRSGNRGMCAQPCRKKYEVPNENSSYFLSPKDQMFGVKEIEKLKSIGIDSIKIEGRMKEPNYVFTMVQYYKNLIQGQTMEEKSSSLFNRGYSKGYFYGTTHEIINPKFSSNIGEKIGTISGKKITLEKNVTLGDGFSYLSSNFEILGGNYLNKIQLKGHKGKYKQAKKGDVLLLPHVPHGSKYIFRNYNKELHDTLEQEKKQAGRKKEISLKFTALYKQNLEISCITTNEYGKKITVCLIYPYQLEKALKKKSTVEEIREKISELGNSSFSLSSPEIIMEKDSFLPLSLIKKIRREVIEKLEQELLNSYRRIAPPRYNFPIEENKKREKLDFYFIVENEEQKKYLESQGYSDIFMHSFDIAKENELVKHNLSNPFCSNLYQILKNSEDSCIANWNLNICNAYTAKILEKIPQLKTLVLSPEMSFKKLEKFGETSQQKALLAYAKLKGMYLEISFKEEKKEIRNQEGDCFKIIKNALGHTEIYLQKPLNILSLQDKIKTLGISIMILQFTDENFQEISFLLDQIKTLHGPYEAYNYEKGVY